MTVQSETLVWDANSEPDLAGYRVYYRDQADADLTMIDVGNVTRCPFTTLLSGHTYLFAVSAYNLDDVESDLSEFVVYTVPSGFSFTVAWEPSPGPGAVTYKVSCGLQAQAAATLSTGTNLSQVFTGLVPGSTYYFYATAYDSLNRIVDNYEQVTLTIPAGASTMPPVTLRRLDRAPKIVLNAVSGIYVGPANVPLTVSASDTDGRVLRVDYYSGTTKIGSSTVAPFSFTWTGVPAGTYTLNATATDDVGNVTRSSNVGLTVYALPAPVGLAAVAGSSTTATVSWKDNTTNESGYYLYRSPGTATFTQIAAPAAGVTNYTDSSLAPGGTYQYRLVAFNANGQSPAVTTAALVLPPNPPANFKATVTNSAIQLSWTAAAGAKGYSVLRLSTVSNAWTTIGTTTALSFRDTNVVSGPVYYYWLTAQNTGGQASAAGIQTASLVAPAAPAGVTATPVAGGIRINWTDMSYNEDSFAVERSLDGVYFATTATLPANSNTWTDPGVISGTKYYYRVRSSLSGISSYSAVVNCIAP